MSAAGDRRALLAELCAETSWRRRARLLQADYRETLALCGGAADLVATSPPYADARTYGAAITWTFSDYASLGEVIFAALRPGGHALVNLDAPVRHWRPGFGTERGLLPWRVMLDWTDRVGFRAPDRLAFARFGSPGEYRGRFRNDFEPLFWFQRPGAAEFFDRDALAVRAALGRPVGMITSSRRPDGSMRVRRSSGPAAENGIVHRGTLWDYGVVGYGHSGADDLEGSQHPARWPLVLAEDIVRCFAPSGGLVCDPFLGSGTTLVAALESGRRFVGGDLLARADGVPWVEVAAAIADQRCRQQRLVAAP